MPTVRARIESLRAKIAEKEEKLANLKAAQKLTQGIHEHQARLEELEKIATKESASEKRKRDKRAKIVMVSGITLLPPNTTAIVVRAAHERLADRDRVLITKWCEDRAIILANAVQLPPLAVGVALSQVIAGMSPGNLEMLITEILGAAVGDDREVLERWFADLATAKNRQKDAKGEPTQS